MAFGLGVISPLILALLPFALGMLLYAYRRGGRGSELVLPSVFLLRKLSRPAVAPRRIRPPLRILLELLLAALLIAAAAGLFIRSENARVIVVLDNSLSMAARGFSGAGAESLFSQAREELLRSIEALPLGTEVEPWTTSPALTSLSGGFVSARSAAELLGKATVVYGPDNLAAHLERLLRRSEGARLIVASNQRIRLSGELHSERLLESRTVSLASSTNIAITDARLIAATSTTPSSAVFGLGLFADDAGKKSAEIKLAIESFDPRSTLYRTLSEQRVTVDSSARTEVRVALPEAAAIRAEISPVEGQGGSLQNALREDDFAFLAASSALREVRIVSDLAPQELGAAKLTAFRVKAQTPEQFMQRKDSSEAIVIFHRHLPATLPRAPLLIILPPVDSVTFGGSVRAGRSSATRWLEGHPLTSYVNFAAFSVPEQLSLSVPGWAQEIVRTTSGPALYAGDLDGRRVVVSGFELFPYEGRASPLSSILLLNMLRWLSDSSTEFGTLSVHVPIALPESAASGAQVFLTSAGRRTQLPLENRGRQLSVLATEPGFLSLGEGQGASLLGAVNFFDSSESRLTSAEAMEVRAPPLLTAEGAARSLSESCILGALALLLVDLVWWLIRGALSTRKRHSRPGGAHAG